MNGTLSAVSSKVDSTDNRVSRIAEVLPDMKGILSAVSSKVESTDNRVSRIAEVLPEVKARVAWEEVNEPLTGVVLTTKPKKNEANQWKTVFKVYDAKTSELTKYIVVSRHRELVANAVAGKVRRVDRNAPTFMDLVYHSEEAKEPVAKIPANVDAHTSFVVRNDAGVGKIISYLQKMSGTKVKGVQFKKLSNWKEVAATLDEVAQDLPAHDVINKPYDVPKKPDTKREERPPSDSSGSARKFRILPPARIMSPPRRHGPEPKRDANPSS